MAKAANATTTAYSSSEYWTVDKLKNWDRNPRSIKGERFEELKERLKRQGQIKPLLITNDGTVIGGNMRLRAMKDLGITEVWVSVTDATTDKEIFDLALTDNEEFGYYEKEQVAELAIELGLDPIELKSYALSLGEPTTLDLVVDELGPEISEEDDEAPEVDDSTPPVSVLGEVYQLGPHRLMCGSATEAADVEKLMDGKKADMVFTDPPYGVTYTGGHNEKKRKGIENDELAGEELTDLFRDSLTNAALFAHNHAAFYIWYANGKAVETFGSFSTLELEVRAVICWYKVKSGLGAFMSQYIPNYEPCIYAFKQGQSPQWFGPTDEKTVWELKREGINDMHPTQKPVELPSRAMRNSSRPGQLVLDLFGGSGSTLIAADKTNRICYMMELDPKYVDVIRKRYHKHVTGDEEGWEEATPVVEVAA